MKKVMIFLNLFSMLFYFQLTAQELIKPAKLKVNWVLNNDGDAHIEASSSLDAAGWDYYKKTTGANPDILKRQMERTFPSLFLQNFSYKEEIMNRSWSLSFDALGLSKINAKGLCEIDLDSKNPDVTKLSDKNYVLTYNYANQGSLVQEIDNVTFPAAASDIKQDKDAFGKAMFIYSSSPGGGSGSWITLILGIILIIIGALMFLRSKPAMAVVKK